MSLKVFESFFYTLMPRLDIKDEHIVKMMQLKLQTPDRNTGFINQLNEGIELMIRSKAVREFAANY